MHSESTPSAFANGLFRAEIEGLPAFAFSSCRGLSALTRYLAIAEGGATSPRYFRDDQRFGPLVLERLLDADSSLWNWFECGDARDGAITLLDPSGTSVARWTFSRGRPTEWRGPTLDAANVSVALEELEIVHEGLKWEDPERTEGADV